MLQTSNDCNETIAWSVKLGSAYCRLAMASEVELLDGAPESGFAALGPEVRSSQGLGHLRAWMAQCLLGLELLTCGCMEYADRNIAPHTQGGALVFLALTSFVSCTAWLSLEPSWQALPLGLLTILWAGWSLLRSSAFCAAAVAGAVLAQTGFIMLDAAGRLSVWRILACCVAIAEMLAWAPVRRAQAVHMRRWFEHFSTRQLLVVELWLWPSLLQLRPWRWKLLHSVYKTIQAAPAQTKTALTEAGVGLGVILGLPLLACGLVSVVFAWRHNRTMSVIIFVVYCCTLPVVFLYPHLSGHQCIALSQVPLGIIMVAIEREQLRDGLGQDTGVWKRQAPLLAAMLSLSWALQALLGPQWGDQGVAASMLVLQLLGRHHVERMGDPNSALLTTVEAVDA